MWEKKLSHEVQPRKLVIVGKGNLAGKGVYADRNFKKGEVVIKYSLKPLTKKEFKNLPEGEQEFTHMHGGTIYLYSEPERYVNHSETPNTYQDLTNKCDVALRNIKKGEMITTDAAKDDILIYEVEPRKIAREINRAKQQQAFPLRDHSTILVKIVCKQRLYRTKNLFYFLPEEEGNSFFL